MSDESSTNQKYIDDLLTCPDVTGMDIKNKSGQQCSVLYVEEIKGKPKRCICIVTYSLLHVHILLHVVHRCACIITCGSLHVHVLLFVMYKSIVVVCTRGE